MNVLDVITTCIGLSSGAVEGNVVVSFWTKSWWMLTLYKVVVISLALALMSRFKLTVAIWVLTIMGLFVVANNIWWCVWL